MPLFTICNISLKCPQNVCVKFQLKTQVKKKGHFHNVLKVLYFHALILYLYTVLYFVQ